MEKPRPNFGQRQGSFFWQGALIVLPVVALAVLGFMLLRQDRARVESELREQASGQAGQLAGRMEAALLGETNITFIVDADGGLRKPVPRERVPIPRVLDIAALPDAAKKAWEEAVAIEAAEPAAAPAAWQRVAHIDLPREWQAQALFRMALHLKSSGQSDAAADAFARVSRDFGDVRTPAGLPLQPLAELHWVRAANVSAAEKREALERCLAAAIAQPSAITSQLLARAAELEATLPTAPNSGRPPVYSPFQALWREQEARRQLYSSARLTVDRAHGATFPAVFWFPHAGVEWLAVCSADAGNRTTVACQPQNEVSNLVLRLGREQWGAKPAFAAAAQVAGRPILSAPGVSLATAATVRDGLPFVSAGVYPADPGWLQKRAQARLLWFASLIGAALLAALVGLFAAWRAFRRQQLLADLKSNFVSSVSHELRAPIASVRLLAEGLQRGTLGEDPARREQYFRFIVQECRRLSALIENVLDFSRIEHGRKQYELDLTDLTALVSETVSAMSLYAAECDVPVLTQMNGPVVSRVDGRAIQQALVNLIDNAIKHSRPQAPVTVGLGTAPATNGNGRTVELWVEDKGEGIPPEDHQRIFERFYRRGSELRRETQGVGIGLSIVKHIAEAHGGMVVVDSEVGQGSRFTIRLPSHEGET